MTVGFVLSSTTTVAVQDEELLCSSVTVSVTSVVPTVYGPGGLRVIVI